MKRTPKMVQEANARLDRIRQDLAFVFDAASTFGDEWAAATVTAARRALGGDDENTCLRVIRARRQT